MLPSFVKVMPRDYKRVLHGAGQGRGRRHASASFTASCVGSGASMGKVTGFIEIARKKPPTRPVARAHPRLARGLSAVSRGGAEGPGGALHGLRHPVLPQGCPLGNLIPDWNDLVYRDRWKAAIDRLHATNNFPEFTGRLCPAPCEGACVLGINNDPVTIKAVEVSIIDRAFDEGWVTAQPPEMRTGKRVAVVGSGPAGLAAAAQLNRAGTLVTVFERADRIGGLLRYGIPEFKLEKRFLDRRLDLLTQEGDRVPDRRQRRRRRAASTSCAREFDAIVLAGGSTRPRDLPVPGRELDGHPLRDGVPDAAEPAQRGRPHPDERFITAKDKHVIIIGGGDTGADCLGTAHRQGAASVHQLELLPRPPDSRADGNPWPLWPNIFRVSSAHEEGGERLYSIVDAEIHRRREGPRDDAARDQGRGGDRERPDGVQADRRAASSS